MSKNKKKDISLFDDNEEVDTNLFGVNKNYAERYDNWRGKEEMQKLKDRYGDVGLDEASDESTSESEDEDAQELTKDVELEFFKALSLLKSKDSKIYDKENTKFFENMEKNEDVNNKNDVIIKKNEKKSSKEKKPYQLKDLEREMIMEKMKKSENGENIDEHEFENTDEARNDAYMKNLTNKRSYFEEQEDLKKSLKKAIGKDDDDDEDEVLQYKVKSKEQEEKEEEDYVGWLKGKSSDIKDSKIKKNMESLHDYWTDPKLPESEKFLRDYILNKRYIDKDDNEDNDEEDNELSDDERTDPKAPSMKINSNQPLDQPLDFVELSDEEKIIDNQEEFERKYNFRFEEPDPDFIKAYPRTIVDSVRREKNRRKEKRDDYKKRKELEKTKKKEEIKRLKNLKRMEIMSKIEKLKRISGKEKLSLNEDDLEKDFEPEEYEKRMQQLFNDDYYETNDNIDPDNENDDDKPVFTDDEADDEKYMNWDKWENEKEDFEKERKLSKKEKKAKKKAEKEAKDEEGTVQDPEFDMDCEPEVEEGLIKNKNGKKMTKLAKALLKKKPIFNPDDKSFEEYFDEYYKLDCEDVIGGDLPCRFKYREVVPNDFGLDIEEIFGAKDQELNQWASLKKAIQFRPIKDEINDVKVFKNKRDHYDLKKKILQSIYNEDDGNEDENNEKEIENDTEEKKEEKVSKKKPENDQNDDQKVQQSHKRKKEKSVQENKVSKKSKKTEVETKVQDRSESKKSKKTEVETVNKNKSKKKNKNILESMSSERLLAYGIEPKKFHKKLKYGSKTSKTD